MSHRGLQASISNSPPGTSSKILFQYWKDLFAPIREYRAYICGPFPAPELYGFFFFVFFVLLLKPH